MRTPLWRNTRPRSASLLRNIFAGSQVSARIVPEFQGVTQNGGDRIDLSWAAVPGASYELQSSTNGGTTWSALVTQAGTTYSHTGLSFPGSYTYRVRAVVNGVNSDWSASVTETMVDVPAAPGGLTVTGATTSSISLSWNDTADEGSYLVEVSVDGLGSWSSAGTTGQNVVTFTHSGLAESVQRHYRVTAVNKAGGSIPSSTANSWTVPAAPTGLTATATSSTQINLSWNDVSTGNQSYKVERSTDNSSWTEIATGLSATATTYSATGLTASTLYYFRVRAANAARNSDYSSTASATTQAGSLSPSWTLDFSTGEPWANGTNYVFSSTASTSRTFVNSSGYVAPCVANLTQRSEDLANAAWTKTRVSITANDSTAPDGTTTADRIVEDTANNFRGVDSNNTSLAAGGNRCWSIYVKKPSTNGRSIVGIAVEDGGNGYFGKRFDLDAGTAVGADYNTNTTNITNLAFGIVNVGSGWYRCWVSARSANAGACDGRVSPMLSSTSAFFAGLADTYQGDGVSGILAWGGQFEEASTPSPYSATTTSSNGIPRLTHNSSGQRLGLLVEPQRTNLLLRSTDFSTSWLGGNTNVPADSVTAPDNLANTTSKIAANTTNAAHWRRLGASVTVTGTTYVFSVFFKAGGGAATHAVLQIETTGTNDRSYTVKYDTATGARTDEDSGNSPVNTGSPAQAESYPNGWYRAWVRIENTSPNTGIRAYVGLSNAATGIAFPTFAGAAGDADFIWFWGAQIEASTTTPTSFIPTVASGVTRQADIAYVETADVTNWGRPGSFVVEYYKPLEQSGGVVVADDDGAGNAGRLGLEYSAGGPRIVYGTSGSGSGGTDTAGLNKVGWAWNGSGAATRSALNGSALDTSLATSFDPTLTDGINLGGNIDWTALPLTVSAQPNVVIRRVRFWNSQLSAADLNTLTT